MTHPPTPPTDDQDMAVQMPGSQEIYDEIMSQIEPDLTSNQLPLLEEKYKDETPEDRQQRMEHYDLALSAT